MTSIALGDKYNTPRKRAHRRYYLTHKQRADEASRKWQKDNPEKRLEVIRRAGKKFNTTPRGIWHILKKNSKRRNREFNLQVNEFIKWYEGLEKICIYCDKPQVAKRLEIERLDNSIGYVLTNMALACEDCNEVKGKTLSFEEMKIVGEIIMKKRWKV